MLIGRTRSVRELGPALDGQMTLRWVAGALSDAKGQFRKLRGHRDMKVLLAALKAKSADAAPVARKAA